MNTHRRRDPSVRPEVASTGTLDETRVTAADLKRIDQISALLATLNDASAGADQLARHVRDIPVLGARIAARFASRLSPIGPNAEVGKQIALLGNRALESILLELLEDIVALHSELQPEARVG
jgi:hypothetical protein